MEPDFSSSIAMSEAIITATTDGLFSHWDRLCKLHDKFAALRNRVACDFSSRGQHRYILLSNACKELLTERDAVSKMTTETILKRYEKAIQESRQSSL